MGSDAGVQNAKPAQVSQTAPGRNATTRFTTGCSVCGRRILVPIEHLGRKVACAHCGCQFIAADPESLAEDGSSALNKADRCLARLADDRVTASSAPRPR